MSDQLHRGSGERQKEKRITLLSRVTVTLLLVGAMVSFYEALTLVGISGSSQFAAPLAVFGGLKVLVAFLCTKGKSRSFATAAVVALIGTASDIILGGSHYFDIAIFIAPSIATAMFSISTFRAMRSTAVPASGLALNITHPKKVGD